MDEDDGFALIGRQSFNRVHERFPENIPLLRLQNSECLRNSDERIPIRIWLTCHFGWWQVNHSNAAFPPPSMSTNCINPQSLESFVEPTFVEIELVGEVACSVCDKKISQVFQDFLAEVCSIRYFAVRDLNHEIRFASPKQDRQHGAHQLLVVRPPSLTHKMDETLRAQVARSIAIDDQEMSPQV